MVVTGEGSAKLLLFGEHSVLYGHPAIGMALPWRTRVSISENKSQAAWGLPELDLAESGKLLALIELMFETFPSLKKTGYQLAIDSDVPKGMGFGSSAALCVALVKAVVTALAHKLLPDSWANELLRELGKLWRLATKAERLFHGKSSGIDTGLSLFGKMRGFLFEGQPEDFPIQSELKAGRLNLIVGGVSRSGDTRKNVKLINEKFLAGDQTTLDAINRLGLITTDAMTCFEKNKTNDEHSLLIAKEVGRLAVLAEKELVRLGLGSEVVSDLLEHGRAAGAIGGKTSGAGSGGAFYLVAPDKETAESVFEAVRARMTSLGLSSYPLIMV